MKSEQRIAVEDSDAGCLDQLAMRVLWPERNPLSKDTLESEFILHTKIYPFKKIITHKLVYFKFLIQVTVLLAHQQLPFIVYCHSENGSSVQSCQLLAKINADFNLVAFDFAGCAPDQKEKSYLSYGYRQADQLQKVIALLKLKFNEPQIILWGRGMGACAIIKLGCQQFVVLDSPIRNHRELYHDKMKSCGNNFLSKCWFSCLLFCVQRKLQSLSLLQSQQLNFERDMDKADINSRIIFMANSNQRQKVDFQNSIYLYANFKGKYKDIFIFNENSFVRSPRVLSKVLRKLKFRKAQFKAEMDAKQQISKRTVKNVYQVKQ